MHTYRQAHSMHELVNLYTAFSRTLVDTQLFKPAPLAVFAAEFSSTENPPKKIRLAVFDDVLDFWSKNAQVGIYPTLCQLANIHLSIIGVCGLCTS